MQASTPAFTEQPLSVPVERQRLELQESCAELRAQLQQHSLYNSLNSAERLRSFCEHHVVCVFDFMVLLKSLERDLCGGSTPWLPPQHPRAARLIHEIVLDEETDQRQDGRIQSHFEWYLEAMRALEADTEPIQQLIASLRSGQPLQAAFAASELPAAARQFGSCTLQFLQAPLHERASAFFHGREEIIPSMFLPLVEELQDASLQVGTLISYFQRHIEVDSGDHGPRSAELLDQVCGTDEHRLLAKEAAALKALSARKLLWDSIVASWS